jgi:hypothetical protein
VISNNIENQPKTHTQLGLNCDIQQECETNTTLTHHLAQTAIPNNVENIPKLTHNLAQAASHYNIETHSQKLAQHIA